MVSLILIAAAAVVAWLVWYIVWYSFLWVPVKLGHIPFPPYHSWILGNFPETHVDFPEVHLKCVHFPCLQRRRYQICQTVLRMCGFPRFAREYAKNGVFGWRFFFNYPRVCFTDVEAVKHILVKNSLNYVKPAEMDIGFSAVLGRVRKSGFPRTSIDFTS